MIEKLATATGLTIPCYEVLDIIKEVKDKNISVAEIGVGIGATALEIMKLLNENDHYYMFGFEDDVLELESDLRGLDFKCKNIHAMGNSRRTYDSYNWSLAQLYLSSDNKDIFDIVYLDGGHIFFHDALACCLLKKLTKTGGYIVFDDIDWSYAISPTSNPKKWPMVTQLLTEEQIETCQVAMIVDIFMKDDPTWELVEKFSSSHRKTYKRVK